MDNDDWDLSAIVRSCKATTFTNPTTVFETPTPNTSTNNTRSPLKPTDFIDLEKLTTNINPNTTIPTSTFTMSTPTSTTNILKPTFTIRTPTFPDICVHDNNQNSTFYDVPTLGVQQQMQSNPGVGLFTRVYIPTKVNCIKVTRAHFDLAYNHPSVQQQPQRELNQLPIQVTQINSVVLPNTHPQPKKYRSRNRKYQQMNLVCHVNAQKLSEDPWAWRKYGQKPIKGSPYPRNYYKCSSARDCAARKLVDKSTSKEDIFVVTYVGQHNHEKPVNRNFCRFDSSKPDFKCFF